MIQIRLSRGSTGDIGGGAAMPSLPAESVTCPDHLVLADLSVAKSIGAVTSSSSVRSVGRRSRRYLGQKVHFCFRCDFPIAIYGRLIPCEHAFCLACARSDSSCFLCEERIQKIQTIKMMEGIFVCAATDCIKTFLKRSDFELHVSEIHADRCPDTEREGGNEADAVKSTTKQSSPDPNKQCLQQPESSTAPAPPRLRFPPNSNSHPQDHEERPRGHQFRGQLPPRVPPPQLRPPPYHNLLQPQPLDYLRPLNFDEGLVPSPSFNFPPFLTDASQPYYNAPYEMPAPEQGSSVLGIPPAPIGISSFQDNFSRPWGMTLVGMPFPPLKVGQGIPDGFMPPGDPCEAVYGRVPEGLPTNNPFPVKESEKPPLPISRQLNSRDFSSGDVGQEGPVYGWQND